MAKKLIKKWRKNRQQRRSEFKQWLSEHPDWHPGLPSDTDMVLDSIRSQIDNFRFGQNLNRRDFLSPDRFGNYPDSKAINHFNWRQADDYRDFVNSLLNSQDFESMYFGEDEGFDEQLEDILNEE